MKPTEKPAKSSAVTLLALLVLGLAAGGTWMALRGGDAPRTTRHLATQAEAAAAAAQDQHRPDRSPQPAVLAAALPSRQFKLGDQFTYHLDSSRQLAGVASKSTVR